MQAASGSAQRSRSTSSRRRRARGPRSRHGATLTGGVNVDVEATSRRQAETEVESGASGDDTTVAPGVALLLITERAHHGQARDIRPPISTATGAITVKATHEGEYSTEAKAVAAGSTAVGASIALNIVLDWRHAAEVARNIQGASVDVTADTSVSSEAKADATAKGADKSGDDADKKKQSEVDNNPNTTREGRHAADGLRQQHRHGQGQQRDRARRAATRTAAASASRRRSASTGS